MNPAGALGQVPVSNLFNYIQSLAEAYCDTNLPDHLDPFSFLLNLIREVASRTDRGRRMWLPHVPGVIYDQRYPPIIFTREDNLEFILLINHEVQNIYLSVVSQAPLGVPNRQQLLTATGPGGGLARFLNITITTPLQLGSINYGSLFMDAIVKGVSIIDGLATDGTDELPTFSIHMRINRETLRSMLSNGSIREAEEPNETYRWHCSMA